MHQSKFLPRRPPWLPQQWLRRWRGIIWSWYTGPVPPRCTKCNSPPINVQWPYCCRMVYCSAGFNVSIKGLTSYEVNIIGLRQSRARAPCVRSSVEIAELSVNSATSSAVRSSASVLRVHHISSCHRHEIQGRFWTNILGGGFSISSSSSTV